MVKRLRHPLLLALSFVAGLLLSTAPAEAQPTFSLEIQPDDVIGLNELAVLRIRLVGASNLQRSPPSFEVENFEVVGGPSQSTSLSIVNGVTSSSVILSWHLRPIAVGKARVHSAVLRLEGETYNLPSREVEVVEQSSAPPRRRRSDPFSRFFSNDPFNTPSDPFDSRLGGRQRRPRRQATAPEVFLTAEASPKNPWKGQQVLYTLYLYTQVTVRSVNPEELPTFKGFWSELIPQPEELEPELVIHDGKEFGKVVLLQRALFPRRAGTLEIEPVVARLAAAIPDNSPFGSLMPRTQDIRRQSNPITVEVRDLPAAPPGFQGAVGRLRLNADLAPRDLEVGQAATLNLTLEGRGHLQGLGAPVLPEMLGIQIFPPQQQSDEGLRGKSVISERSWSFVLVPEKPGQWQLPPIEIPYFDPVRGRYEVASTEAFDLTVRGTTQFTAQKSGRSVELHPIRTAALPAVEGIPWASLTPWLFATPWTLALFLFAWRRRGGSGHQGERRALLDDLRTAAQEERPRQAAAAIEEAWRNYLTRRYDIPQGCPSTGWAQKLVDQGVNNEAAENLVQLADDLHYLRYAPKLSSTDELRAELVERSHKLLKVLR